MVSKASEDLPDPESPVMTVSRLRGMETEMSLRLCSRAPRTTKNSLAIAPKATRSPGRGSTGSSLGSRLLPYGAPNDHSAVITVIVDDLAYLAVDAVVRPADESLAPLTSEGSRLDRLAGDRFAAQRR